MDNWINASESLPTINVDSQSEQDSIRVIVCTKSNDVREMAFSVKRDEPKGVWLETNGQEALDAVTHWMRMPLAVEGEAADTEFEPIEHYQRCHKIKADVEEILANLGQHVVRMMANVRSGADYHRASPAWMSRCEDCNKITPRCENGFMFHYLVRDELWKEATSPDLGIILCLHCLQKRLGRPLVAEDFPKHRLNYHNYVEKLVKFANDPEARNEFL